MTRTAPLPPAEPASTTTPRPATRQLRPRPLPWDQAPLCSKAYAIVMIAVIGGLLLGTVEAQLGHRIWPMLLGVSGLVLLGCGLVNLWIQVPLQRLIGRLERLGRSRQRLALRRLPVNREDELGQIARAVRQLGETLVRHEAEASTLRRTLETRAAEAARRATHQLERLAMRDPLTDLGNRRCLDDKLPALLRDARDAEQGELMCILMDIDNFKPLNDTLGHAAGDEVLVFLGSLVAGCARAEDLAVRLGGDEFVVMLPDAGPDRARQYADNVRSLFRQQTHTMYPDGPALDLSIGIAGLHRDACADGEALLAHADKNLYKAKRSGKGQTCGCEAGEA